MEEGERATEFGLMCVCVCVLVVVKEGNVCLCVACGEERHS